MTVVYFPRRPFFAGVVIEIDDATIIFESDGSRHQGFDVRMLNHPIQGDVLIWHGLDFGFGMFRAEDLQEIMPGSVIRIACEDPPDDDDPDGGDEAPVEIAA